MSHGGWYLVRIEVKDLRKVLVYGVKVEEAHLDSIMSKALLIGVDRAQAARYSAIDSIMMILGRDDIIPYPPDPEKFDIVEARQTTEEELDAVMAELMGRMS